MNVYTIHKKIRNQDKVLIIAKSSERKDFVKIKEELTEVFTPRLIKVSMEDYTFLSRMSEG